MATKTLETPRPMLAASRSTAVGDASFASAVPLTQRTSRDADLLLSEIEYNVPAQMFTPRQAIVYGRESIDEQIEKSGYDLSTVVRIAVLNEPPPKLTYDVLPNERVVVLRLPPEQSGTTINDLLGMEPWIGSSPDAQQFEPPFLGTRRLMPPRRRIYREGTLGSFNDTSWPS